MLYAVCACKVKRTGMDQPCSSLVFFGCNSRLLKISSSHRSSWGNYSASADVKFGSINPSPFGSILFFCLKNEGSRPELFAMLIAMSVELVAVVSLRLGKSSSVCMKVFTFLSKACKTGSSSSNMQTLAFLCSTKVSTSAMAYIG